jgi:nicotinamide-nucleotide amidase
MRVALLAVGDELLLGHIINGNAAWLGHRLTEAGLQVVASAVVGDDVGPIVATIRWLFEDAEAVIVCGGLGPTSDDVTRTALAGVAGVALRRDADLERAVHDWHAARGAAATVDALRMADLPEGATAVGNAAGTAPGVRLEVSGRLVVAVPGVPAEMQDMVERLVLPELLARSGVARAIVTRTVHVALLGESAVADRVRPMVQDIDQSGLRLAYLAGLGVVQVRLTATAADVASAAAALEPRVDRLRELLGDAAWGVDDETLDTAVHRLLAAGGATVAVAESLTGGLLGGALTDMPGSSATFRGGITPYATDLKTDLLGVDPGLLMREGAVGRRVAAQMAVGARARLNATYGVATTGVAGPEPQDGQPVGTVYIAVARPSGVLIASPALTGDRDRLRRLTVVHSLDLLRRILGGLATPSAEQHA